MRIQAIAESIQRGPSEACDRLLQRYPPARHNPLSADLIAECNLILNAAGFQSGENCLDDALSSLVAARSSASTDQEKARQNALLARAYFPICHRRKTHPESFAKVLMGSYGLASDLIRDHLKITQGGFLHDAAVEYVSSVRPTSHG